MIGINDNDDIIKLANAGANEFFCGLKTDYGVLNVKSNSNSANINGFDKLSKILRKAKQYNKAVYLTRNLRNMSLEQINQAIAETKVAVELGIKGVIISNLYLLSELRKLGLPIKLISSSLMPPYNIESVKFYKKLGINRQILPRQFNLNEICQFLCTFPDYEFEVFIFYSRCSMLDGLCRLDVKHPTTNSNCINIGEIYINEQIFNNSHTHNLECYNIACGACALYKLLYFKNVYLKVASRGLKFKEKLNTTRYLNMLSNLLCENNISYQEFVLEASDNFKKYFGYRCNKSMCYY